GREYRRNSTSRALRQAAAVERGRAAARGAAQSGLSADQRVGRLREADARQLERLAAAAATADGWRERPGTVRDLAANRHENRATRGQQLAGLADPPACDDILGPQV